MFSRLIRAMYGDMSKEEMSRAQEQYKTAKTINRIPEDRRPKESNAIPERR